MAFPPCSGAAQSLRSHWPPVSEAMSRPLRVGLACSPSTLRPSLTRQLAHSPTSKCWWRPMCPVAWAHPAAEGHAASEGGLGPKQGSPAPRRRGDMEVDLAGGAALCWGRGRTRGRASRSKATGRKLKPGQARGACGWRGVKGWPGGSRGELCPPGAVPALHALAGLTEGTSGDPGSSSSLRKGDRCSVETGDRSLLGFAQPRPTRNPRPASVTRPHALVVCAEWQPHPASGSRQRVLHLGVRSEVQVALPGLLGASGGVAVQAESFPLSL